jgi:hypothetical protein
MVFCTSALANVRNIWYKILSKINTYPKKLKFVPKNTIIDKPLTYASQTSTVTKTDRNQLKIFEKNVYRRILGPVHDDEKQNWRILFSNKIYAFVKKPTIRHNMVTQITDKTIHE